MQLKRLDISNFMRCHSFSEKLEPLTVICGPNESGKSSIRDAIDFAFTGSPGRAGTKKEYHRLLTRGASTGKVAAVYGDGGEIIQRDIVSGRAIGAEPQLPAALPLVLGAGRFARDLDAGKRRAFLYGLMGISMGVDEIRKRLEKRGIDAALIERSMPKLQAGFAAPLADAVNERRSKKAAWEEVAGTDYGEKIAEGWSAKAPPFDQRVLTQVNADVDGWQIEVERLNREAGRLDELTAARAELPTLREQGLGFAAASADENRLQSELDALRAELAAIPLSDPAVERIVEQHAAPAASAAPASTSTSKGSGPGRRASPASASAQTTTAAPAAQPAATITRGPDADLLSGLAPMTCPHCRTALEMAGGGILRIKP